MSASANRSAPPPAALPLAGAAAIRAAVDAAVTGAPGGPPWEYARSVLAAIGRAACGHASARMRGMDRKGWRWTGCAR
jgi:hypothetical protein